MGLKKRNKVSAEFSMSSLTDIIFLLLIFFMLTSTLVSPNALNLKLPSSSSQTVAPATISVSIKKNGQYYHETTPVKLSELKRKVRSDVRKAADPKKVTVVINTEEDTPIKYVVEVMDMALTMKIGAILATEPR